MTLIKHVRNTQTRRQSEQTLAVGDISRERLILEGDTVTLWLGETDTARREISHRLRLSRAEVRTFIGRLCDFAAN